MKAILAGALETGLGTVLSNVTVFVENGKIADIVEGLDPKNADEVMDASEMVVTPGLIDAHTHIGTYCEGFPESMEDANDMVTPVVPHLRILDAIYQDDTAFADALAGGITCVQTLPGSGNVIGGQGAIIKTATASGGRKKTADEMVVKAPLLNESRPRGEPHPGVQGEAEAPQHPHGQRRPAPPGPRGGGKLQEQDDPGQEQERAR